MDSATLAALHRPAVVLRMATRTPAEPDMPPCHRTWGHGCGHTDGRMGAHTCWTWSGWPHICRCLRCAGRAR